MVVVCVFNEWLLQFLKFLPVFWWAFHCVGTELSARSGLTLAAGQITETALRFLLENIFRNFRVLARHASRVLNKIQNVLGNLRLNSDYGQPLFFTEVFFLARLLLNTSTRSLWKIPFGLCTVCL